MVSKEATRSRGSGPVHGELSIHADQTQQRDRNVMKIGLVPTLNPSFGGSYQYALAMLDAAIDLARRSGDRDGVVRGMNRRAAMLMEAGERDRVAIYALASGLFHVVSPLT